jgi:hypothetical protein
VLAVFDQWHCTLRGDLNVDAFQRAWRETLRRHPILRSTIHGHGLLEPVQVVHRDVEPAWTIEDWRRTPDRDRAARWNEFLERDRTLPLSLVDTPVMRFALRRLATDQWKFLWSVPALLLDGWSWPLVFRDASRLYEEFSGGQAAHLEPARPYRDYIEWLNGQSFDASKDFWKATLAGFHRPTLVAGGRVDAVAGGERYGECEAQLSPEATSALGAAARSRRLTLSSVVQGAWAMLLGRHSRSIDIVYGAAFAGRPTELQGAESIVGPLVNNVPVRVAVDPGSSAGEFLRALQARLLEVNAHQFLPLLEIQRCSDVPWRQRLFESIVVFQNYLVDDLARRFGGRIEMTEFSGPVHTNYPVMLLAEPGAALRLTLIHDRQRVARADVERWAKDLKLLLERLPALFETPVQEVQALLSPPPAADWSRVRKIRVESQNYVPPQGEMEKAIAGVWQSMFEVDRVGVEENCFDLGGHSLLLVQMHGRLRDTLKTDFPIVTLFEHPTIRSLARHLTNPRASAGTTGRERQDRAERQKQALAEMRSRVKRESR